MRDDAGEGGSEGGEGDDRGNSVFVFDDGDDPELVAKTVRLTGRADLSGRPSRWFGRSGQCPSVLSIKSLGIEARCSKAVVLLLYPLYRFSVRFLHRNTARARENVVTSLQRIKLCERQEK